MRGRSKSGCRCGVRCRYKHTIGFIEPSYVIRKFLDAQRMPQLASYLEALHNRGMANSEHTTLLINCYTKLKEREKLRQFVYSDQAGECGSES